MMLVQFFSKYGVIVDLLSIFVLEMHWNFQQVRCIIIGTKLIYALSHFIVSRFVAILALAFCDTNLAVIKEIKINFTSI